MSDPTVTVELTREQLKKLTYAGLQNGDGEVRCAACLVLWTVKGIKHLKDCWIGKALRSLEEK